MNQIEYFNNDEDGLRATIEKSNNRYFVKLIDMDSGNTFETRIADNYPVCIKIVNEFLGGGNDMKVALKPETIERLKKEHEIQRKERTANLILNLENKIKQYGPDSIWPALLESVQRGK